MKKEKASNQDVENTQPNKDLHIDHRSRVRKRALAEGFRNFEDHQILEFLLYYAIPRKDTNPLAHRLLDRYQSLAGVFDADYHDIARQEEMGEISAFLLKVIPELSRRYLISRDCSAPRLESFEAIGHYLVNFYIGIKEEMPVVLLFNDAMELLHIASLDPGTLQSAMIHPRKIAELALTHQASAVVLAHNHPSNDVTFSKQDMVATQVLAGALSALDIHLIDHIVVGRNGYVGVLSKPQ